MTLAYTRDAAGTGDNFRIGICLPMSAMETPKKILTSEVCFLCKAKVSSEEKIKVFGKSTVAIHSLILRSKLKLICPFTSEAIFPPSAAPNVIIVCFAIKELWTE